VKSEVEDVGKASGDYSEDTECREQSRLFLSVERFKTIPEEIFELLKD
jgi:hypothetical protein